MITCATCRAPMNCPEVSELAAREWAHWHRACRAATTRPWQPPPMPRLYPGFQPEQEWQRRASEPPPNPPITPQPHLRNMIEIVG